VRNLSASEIAAQVIIARDRLGEWPGMTRAEGTASEEAAPRLVTNLVFMGMVVFMGMGEPLYNFDGVKNAIATISDDQGISIGKRRITVSTSGVVPMIENLGNDVGAMLAISLHATRDELRNELVPLNKKYPIKELLDACRAYPGASNAPPIPARRMRGASPSNTSCSRA